MELYVCGIELLWDTLKLETKTYIEIKHNVNDTSKALQGPVENSISNELNITLYAPVEH